jgi:hypothetical protein
MVWRTSRTTLLRIYRVMYLFLVFIYCGSAPINLREDCNVAFPKESMATSQHRYKQAFKIGSLKSRKENRSAVIVSEMHCNLRHIELCTMTLLVSLMLCVSVSARVWPDNGDFRFLKTELGIELGGSSTRVAVYVYPRHYRR